VRVVEENGPARHLVLKGRVVRNVRTSIADPRRVGPLLVAGVIGYVRGRWKNGARLGAVLYIQVAGLAVLTYGGQLVLLIGNLIPINHNLRHVKL